MPFHTTLPPDMQFLLPFLFILAVVFGVLRLSKVFENPGIELLIALALSFFAAQNPTFVELLFAQIGNITTFFIILFFLAFLGELFGFRKSAKAGEHENALMIQGALLFIVLSVGFLIADQLPTIPIAGGITGQMLVFIVAILFVLGIFWSAFKVGEPEQKQPR